MQGSSTALWLSGSSGRQGKGLAVDVPKAAANATTTFSVLTNMVTVKVEGGADLMVGIVCPDTNLL